MDNTGGKPIRIFRKHKDEPYKIYPNEYWSEEQIRKLILRGSPGKAGNGSEV